MVSTFGNYCRTRSEKVFSFLVGGVLFGNQNVGDEAILEGIVNILRKVSQNCEIIVLTNQPHRTMKYFNVKAFRYQFISYRPGKINRALRILSRSFENILQVYLALRSDIIVCAGATMLSDSPATVIRLASWAIFADKRLIYFPGGMNSGNNPDTLKKLLDILKEFDLFMARDIDTKKRLVDAGLDPCFVQVTVDPAFNINLSEKCKNNISELLCFNDNHLVVGIGIANEPDCSEYNNSSEWARIADFIIESFDANVVFLPSNRKKDITVMQVAHNLMKYKERGYVIDTELTPKAMISVISKLEMLISSRMHQLIFSVFATTPFIGISRCEKTDSFLAMLDMKPASTVKYCELQSLKPSLENVWNNRKQFKRVIQKHKADLISRSLKTEELVESYLDRYYIKSNRIKFTDKIHYFLNAFFMRLS